VLPVAAAVCAVVGLAFAFRRWRRTVDTVPDDDDRALVDAARGSPDEANVSRPDREAPRHDATSSDVVVEAER